MTIINDTIAVLIDKYNAKYGLTNEMRSTLNSILVDAWNNGYYRSGIGASNPYASERKETKRTINGRDFFPCLNEVCDRYTLSRDLFCCGECKYAKIEKIEIERHGNACTSRVASRSDVGKI